MRLKSFHVRTFRNIVDSGPIDVDQVTCLVGKNESGKSALLQALHHLNPAKPTVTLDLLDEYPRWLKKEHEITGEIRSAVPISAIFELSTDECADVAAKFGEKVLKSSEVKVERAYAPPNLTVKVEINLKAFIAPFIAALPAKLKKQLGSIGKTSELLSSLESIAESRGEDGTPTPIAEQAAEAKSELEETFGTAPHLTAAVSEYVKDLLPRTFYFSIYSQLAGRYRLEDAFQAMKSQSDDEETQAAADFLRLARTVPATIEAWEFEAANAELESISSLLTKRVKAHWKQNDHLKLRVNLEIKPGDKPDTVERYLQFRVEDTRHDFSSRLDRRSTGFRWFISFIASFLEFEQDENLILLLDEPGLSLHARAQMDLLDTIDTKLANERQVLYSTHSPFMVRTNKLTQARIAEDKGPEIGSTVTNDAGSVSDPDTLFPLQAALGYDVAQSIFVGNQNVLVEGISDFIYLETISTHLGQTARAQLPEGCRLLPAGGASNIPTFIALLGGKLDFVVLLDGNSDRQRVENMIAKGRLDAANIISLGSLSTVKGADIEDLFTPGEYIAFYNGAFGKSVKLKELKGKDRIVKRIERAQGAFDHGFVAAHFLRNLEKSLKKLSGATLDRFENLIKAISVALARIP